MARVPLKYVVVRYVPDIAKDEPVNVGLILQGPEGTMMAKFPEKVDRLQRLPKGTDKKFLRQMLDAMRDQVEHQFRGLPGGVDTEHYLDEWANSLSNQLRLTMPRTTVPDDPHAELERLYSRLVTEGRPTTDQPKEDKRVHSAVRYTLVQAFKAKKRDYQRYIREKVPVPGHDWPEIYVGFAYRNGRATLANPLSLDVTERRAEEKIKVWETNYSDILSTNRYDAQHIVTILHTPSDLDPGLRDLAGRVLGRVSRVVPDTQEGLTEFAWNVLKSAEEWTDEVQL